MSQQAGWYDDPQDDSNLRYWDGVQWTNHTSPKQKPGLERAGQGQQGDAGSGWGQQAGPGQAGGAQGPVDYGGQSGYGGQGQGNPYGQQGQGNPYGQQGQGNPYGQGGQNPYAGQTGQNPYQGQWQGAPMPGGGYQPQVDPRSSTPDGQPLAGWWHRVAARILDGIVLAILGLVLGNLLMPGFFADYLDWSLTQTGTDPFALPPAELSRGLAMFTMLVGVVGLAYEVVLVTLLGGTLGKLATGLRVRLRDEPGNVGWLPSLLRALVYQGPGILGNLNPALSFVSLFTLVNVLWPLWDKNRQALHDKVAKTNVVRKR
ncbi:RDD family protein [Ornithinimicrobium flavum]|uniref:RDD family protein n=1 Tax=Ornithinimicrobium flavum TaxID=1288636 RepID=UPI0013052527|nr:RDD family protein [Ornithinimicrobium flavum]